MSFSFIFLYFSFKAFMPFHVLTSFSFLLSFQVFLNHHCHSKVALSIALQIAITLFFFGLSFHILSSFCVVYCFHILIPFAYFKKFKLFCRFHILLSTYIYLVVLNYSLDCFAVTLSFSGCFHIVIFYCRFKVLLSFLHYSLYFLQCRTALYSILLICRHHNDL